MHTCRSEILHLCAQRLENFVVKPIERLVRNPGENLRRYTEIAQKEKVRKAVRSSSIALRLDVLRHPRHGVHAREEIAKLRGAGGCILQRSHV